jgi:hypothetical protein
MGGAFIGVVNAILASIEKMTLERVFLEWIEILRRCIETDGEYVNWNISLRPQDRTICGQSWDAHACVRYAVSCAFLYYVVLNEAVPYPLHFN